MFRRLSLNLNNLQFVISATPRSPAKARPSTIPREHRRRSRFRPDEKSPFPDGGESIDLRCVPAETFIESNADAWAGFRRGMTNQPCRRGARGASATCSLTFDPRVLNGPPSFHRTLSFVSWNSLHVVSSVSGFFRPKGGARSGALEKITTEYFRRYFYLFVFVPAFVACVRSSMLSRIKQSLEEGLCECPSDSFIDSLSAALFIFFFSEISIKPFTRLPT